MAAEANVQGEWVLLTLVLAHHAVCALVVAGTGANVNTS
jgi:hypothetical protein